MRPACGLSAGAKIATVSRSGSNCRDQPGGGVNSTPKVGKESLPAAGCVVAGVAAGGAVGAAAAETKPAMTTIATTPLIRPERDVMAGILPQRGGARGRGRGDRVFQARAGHVVDLDHGADEAGQLDVFQVDAAHVGQADGAAADSRDVVER